jgi:hypothetical protein
MVRNSLGTGMRPVHHAKAILHKHVCERRKSGSKRVVISLFLWVKTKVFEQEHLTWLQVLSGFLGALTHAIRGELHLCS